MTPDRLMRTLALLAAAVLSGACATSRYTESRIESTPPDVRSRPGSRASLEIQGVKVGIELLDRTPAQEAAYSLGVRLVFEPEAIGYSFDPGQVVLRTVDGREWRGAARGYRLLHPKAAFNLVFGVAVEPDPQAELVLGGLARGRTRLEPVSLLLARHRGRSIDRMYWLEGLMTAVVVPLAVLTYPYGGM